MNFGSILPLEVQSLTSPQDYLVPNKPRKVVSANHKSKLHIKGFLEVGDLAGWKGAGLRNSNPSKHNQITSYHMPIIHPNSKSLLDLTKDLPNFNNVSERLLSSGKTFHSNGSKENHTNQFNTKDKSNNASTGSNNNHDGSTNKSKVPDIQMINKYYGLIPKKFTVHSRQSDSSQRNSKSHGKMPHASRSKSAHPFGTGSRKKLGHLGSSKSLDISEDETHEPQPKISVRLRRGNSLDLTGSLADETEGGSRILMAIGKNTNGCNNVSLVTKKIPVEKQKKWKKSGNLLRSSSLSSMDEDRHRHAREKSTGDNSTDGNTEIQRVIKIDLNNMSWEESFQSCYSPFEEPQSTRESSPVPEKVYSTAIKGSANDMCPLLSSVGSEGNSSGGGWTTSVNSSESGSCSISSGGGGCGSPSSLSLPGDSLDTQNNREQANTHARIDYDEETENLKERESVLNDGESYCRTPTTLPLLSVIGTDDNALRTTIDESSTNRTNTTTISSYSTSGNEINEGESPICNMPVGGESPSKMDGRNNDRTSSVSQDLESRRARMRKTISFDEQILHNKESSLKSPYVKQESEAVKVRRPTTAACGGRQAANSPSVGPKVAPWTQKTGKNLSLSERRSKFQKSVSIHSAAESFDYGEGEGSDCDADLSTNIKATSPPAAFIPNPKSSVYRDTSRKPLFFQPAPEVSTMISQISPIDNLEIQCEIEKVAIMLKNMQNQNKSFIDLTPAAAFISQDTHLTTNTRAGNPTPLIKESDLLSQTSNNNIMVKDTQDINGNPMNANKNLLVDGNNVTLHAFNNNGPGFLAPSATAAAVRSNIGLEDKASILRNTSPLGQPAPHETRENKSMGENNAEKIYYDSSHTTAATFFTGSQAEGSRVVDSPGAKTTQNEGLLSPGEKLGSEEMSNGMGLNGNLHCSSNLKIKESHGAYGSSNTVTSPQITKRPPLRKSVSISCEKELYKTPGDHENEANGNGNSSSKIENKSARPKTAVTLSSRSSKNSSGKTDGSQVIITSHSQRARSLNSQISTTNRSPSPSIKSATAGNRTAVKPNTKENDKIESVISEGTNNGSNKNQASKNRKILIKKALIEINQSSSHFPKKWGVLGRPKTAPSSHNTPQGIACEKSKKSGLMTMISSGSGPTTSHKRQPLKASQPLNGVKPGQVVGKQVTSGNPGEEDGESSETDGKEEGTMNKDATGSASDHNAARKSLHRQSFSLDEGLLLGFSNKEFGWKTQDQDEEPVPSKTETLFQNSKKREECLKIYDKMMKTGLSVKLDTILRGMMTPSEYRVFIKAAENAAREAALAKEEAEAAMIKESLELNENESDAGVSEALGVNTKTHEAVQA